MAELQGLRDAIAELGAQQSASSDAIAEQLTAIAEEIDQLNASSLSQADLDALATQVRDAATVASTQAAAIRANTARVTTIVPDEPVP